MGGVPWGDVALIGRIRFIARLDMVVEAAQAQERLATWIMGEVEAGAVLPGLSFVDAVD